MAKTKKSKQPKIKNRIIRPKKSKQPKTKNRNVRPKKSKKGVGIHRIKRINSTTQNLGRTKPLVMSSLKLVEKQSIHKIRSSPIYRGLGYDLLMAYVYLIKKFRDRLCIAIGDKQKIKATFDPTYVGLVYGRQGNKNVLQYDGGLKSLEEFILKCKKRFFAIPLSIEYPDSGPHFNILVGDTQKKIVERFESYGGFLDEKVHDNLDKDLIRFLKSFETKSKFTYKNPDKFCPSVSLQNHEENNIEKKLASVRRNDYRGYCGMWGVWFVEMKMKNPDLDSKELLEDSIEKMKGMNYRKFIRNYKDHIVEMRKIILKDGGIVCRQESSNKSPNYKQFKLCAKQFMDKELDKYF